MIQAISIPRLADYASFLPGPHLAMVTGSILAGNTAAQFWEVRQATHEPVLLLWDQGNKVFYLTGELAEEATQQELSDLIKTTIRLSALAAGVAYFKVHPLSSSLRAVLPSLFSWCELREVQNLFYGFAQPAPNVVAPPTVADLQFVEIDEAFLLTEVLENISLIRDELRWMWPAMERFYTHGFGVAAVIPGRVICWCTAEYVSPTRCGIGITTDEAYQGHGVATATTAYFVQLCQQRGITPYWECGRWNGPSMRVAEKVGFTKLSEEHFWVGTMG